MYKNMQLISQLPKKTVPLSEVLKTLYLKFFSIKKLEFEFAVDSFLSLNWGAQ